MALGLSAGTWVALASTAAGAMANSGDSQGGTTTQNKTPWSAAVPWLTQNLGTGQQLQQYYQQNPFNQQQQNAYSNMAGNSAYANQLAASVIGQMGNYTPFSQANPSAQFQPYKLPAMPVQSATGMAAPQLAGMPGAQPSTNLNISANPFANGSIPAQVAPVAQQQPNAAPSNPFWTPPPFAGGAGNINMSSAY